MFFSNVQFTFEARAPDWGAINYYNISSDSTNSNKIIHSSHVQNMTENLNGFLSAAFYCMKLDSSNNLSVHSNSFSATFHVTQRKDSS